MNNFTFISIVGSVWLLISLFVFYVQKKDFNIKNYIAIKLFILLIISFYLLIIFFYII